MSLLLRILLDLFLKGVLIFSNRRPKPIAITSSQQKNAEDSVYLGVHAKWHSCSVINNQHIFLKVLNFQYLFNLLMNISTMFFFIFLSFRKEFLFSKLIAHYQLFFKSHFSEGHPSRLLQRGTDILILIVTKRFCTLKSNIIMSSTSSSSSSVPTSYFSSCFYRQLFNFFDIFFFRLRIDLITQGLHHFICQ